MCVLKITIIKKEDTFITLTTKKELQARFTKEILQQENGISYADESGYIVSDIYIN